MSRQPIGTITSFVSIAEYQDQDSLSFAQVRRSQPVFNGTILRTGAESVVSIILSTGEKVTLSEKSQIYFDSSSDSSDRKFLAIELESGNVGVEENEQDTSLRRVPGSEKLIGLTKVSRLMVNRFYSFKPEALKIRVGGFTAIETPEISAVKLIEMQPARFKVTKLASSSQLDSGFLAEGDLGSFVSKQSLDQADRQAKPAPRSVPIDDGPKNTSQGASSANSFRKEIVQEQSSPRNLAMVERQGSYRPPPAFSDKKTVQRSQKSSEFQLLNLFDKSQVQDEFMAQFPFASNLDRITLTKDPRVSIPFIKVQAPDSSEASLKLSRSDFEARTQTDSILELDAFTSQSDQAIPSATATSKHSIKIKVINKAQKFPLHLKLWGAAQGQGNSNLLLISEPKGNEDAIVLSLMNKDSLLATRQFIQSFTRVKVLQAQPLARNTVAVLDEYNPIASIQGSKLNERMLAQLKAGVPALSLVQSE